MIAIGRDGLLQVPPRKVISLYSMESLGTILAAMQTSWSAASTTTVWVANDAIFIPFVMTTPGIMKEMFMFNSASVNGVHSIGLYTEDGYKIVSKQANGTGASQIQTYDIPDVLLPAGVYYMAFASTGTGTYIGATVGAASAPTSGMLGVARQATAAGALPAVATFAPWVSVKVPFIAVAFTSTY